jgi:hypothetical protein
MVKYFDEEMSYTEMKLLAKMGGWIEDNIALWYHPNVPGYTLDGN